MICNRCFIEKPQIDFYRMRRTCKLCVRTMDIKNNPARKARGKIRRLEIKEQLVSDAGGQCFVCNGYFPPEVFDFHHIDPTVKEREVSTITWTIAKAKQEAKKCIMVCANCHRMTHAGRTPVSYGI